MVPYQMNLASGRVLSLATRKQWRRWFMVYLLFILAVIGGAVGMLTRNCVVLARQHDRICLMERNLLNERPGVVTIGGHLEKLSREMADCESQLGAMDNFRKAECRASAVILGLVKVMPSGMDLSQVSIDSAVATIGVEVHVVADLLKNGEGMTPPRLIALWNAEPLLVGRVNHFTSEKSERVKVAGNDVMRWRFSGTLLGGK